MAKKSMIAREIKRQKIVERFASKRQELKKILSDSKATDEEKVFTDEVSAMLHFFKKEISIFPCNKTNIKVTKKEDLETVEQYLKLAGRI